MSPTYGVMIVGVGSAQLVEPLHQKLGSFQSGKTIKIGHLVVGAVESSLGGRAVVANDVINERVVEYLEFLQSVNKASDVVVGVFHETCIDLHLAAQDWFESLRHFFPGRNFGVARG